MSTDYKKYSIEDFVMDKNFRGWVLHPDKGSNLFWERWIDNHQEKVDDLKEARKVLLSLSRIDYRPEEGAGDEVWQRLVERIDEDDKDSAIIPLGPNTILGKYALNQKRCLSPWISRLAGSIILFVAVFVSYQYFGKTSEKTVNVIISKANPRGQKSTVFLPDGSKVYLNSESELKYSSDYNSTSRIVHLRGEAFFEVALDTLRPFIVVTEHLNTIALGTSFNVAAYPDYTPEVSLMTGKVEVISNDQVTVSIILIPGELVSYSKSKALIKKQFDPKVKALWRKQIIYFKDTPIRKALHTLELWYNVTFEIEGTMPDLECTGKFESDYLSNVLNSLGYTLGFTYKIEGKEILLKFN